LSSPAPQTVWPTEWLADPSALDAALARFMALVDDTDSSAVAPRTIGLDTEFVREKTYWPQLALVQIALPGLEESGIDGRILLVDPLVPGMDEALARLLGDPRTLKLMHSAGEDLIAFQHTCGALPEPLFDTQIAAALSGVGAGLGYQKLVQALLGEIVDKGETRSDWLRRPLSPAQLRYAADDVRHLHRLHRDLSAKLDALDRHAWMTEDCTRALRNAAEDAAEPWPHLGLRSAQFLDAAAQARLLRLLRWRESYAREHDRPRSWILDNELAHALARKAPGNVGALQSWLDAQPKAPRRLAGAIWQAMTTALPDEADMPLARNDDRDRNTYRQLQQAVADHSAALGLPDGVLASRRWLEALQDGQDWPGALAGWRRAQLEPVLAPLLAPLLPPSPAGGD
jgi:ribonuclease D